MTARLARWLLSLLLRRIRTGTLTVIEDGERRVYGSGPPAATIIVRSPRMWRMALTGSRGLAEAYARGLWDSPDLTALVRLGARNAAGLDRLRALIAPVRLPIQRLRAYLRASTRHRRRRDVAAHYDLGNELFSRMLDRTMSYSCAVFGEAAATLEDAQVAKLELICDKLELAHEDHLLEIGTGWGALAIHAAATRGCRVTTTTISREQYDHAVTEVGARGARGPGDGAARGLPGPDRPLRQARLDRDDRGRRLAAHRRVLRQMLGAARRRRHDAAPGDHDRRPRLRGREGVAVVHQHPHLPRRMPAVARDHRAERGPPHRHADRAPRGPDPALRGDAPALAAEPRRPWRRARRARVRRAVLGGCGRSTSRYCEAGFAERRICDIQLTLAKPHAHPTGICRFDPGLFTQERTTGPEGKRSWPSDASARRMASG